MRPLLTAVIAAIEAGAVALAGLVVVGIPAVFIWIVTFGLAAEPSEVLTTAFGLWQLAHFVPLSFELSAESSAAFGLAPEPLTFVVSLAPLGVTLITWLLGARSGWRFGRRGGTGAAGVFGGIVGFAACALVIAILSQYTHEWPLWIVTLVPTLSYGAASLAAFLIRAARDGHSWWTFIVRSALQALERTGLRATATLPSVVAETLRLAAALLATLVALSAVALTAAIVIGYVDITRLTQSLQLDPFGIVVLFFVQLAFVPTLLVWAASWLTGAGFALGIGSSASPFGALLGPLPAVPVLGGIPQGWGSAGVIAPTVLALAGIMVGVFFVRRPEQRRRRWLSTVLIPMFASALFGLVVAGLCTLASGSIGPDRLSTVGPEPWVVGGLAAGEAGLGALIGVAVGRIDTSRMRTAIVAHVPGLDAVRKYRDSSNAGHNAGHATGEVGLGDDQQTLDLSDVRSGRQPTPHDADVARAERGSAGPGSAELGNAEPGNADIIVLSSLESHGLNDSDVNGFDVNGADVNRADVSGAGFNDDISDQETVEVEPVRSSQRGEEGGDAGGSSTEHLDSLEEGVEDGEELAGRANTAHSPNQNSSATRDELFDGMATEPESHDAAGAHSDPESEELLRTYAWDAAVEETSAPKRPGRNWRKPRKER